MILSQSKASQNSLVNLALISQNQSYVTLSSNLAKAKSHLAFQTGFEFKKRHAFPILKGVVVALENEALLLEVKPLCSLLSLVSIRQHQTRHTGKRKKKQCEKPRSSATSRSLNTNKALYIRFADPAFKGAEFDWA